MVNCSFVPDRTDKGTEYGLFGDYLYSIVNKNIRQMSSKFSSVMSKDDVFDLTQDTWLKIVDKSGNYDPNRNFEGWVYRICKNAVYDYADRRDKLIKRQCTLPEKHDKEVSSVYRVDRSPDFNIIQKESVDHINKGIASLKPKKQQVIEMVINGVPYKKMSTVIGCRDNTVKTIVCRVRQELNEAI